MKLHSIHLQNYRGITDARVEFTDGVTVVEGPNEVGKSSIHQAITHLRDDKSSSRKGSIKDIQPVGADVGPEVELHLSTGGYELKYRKRWLKQQETQLNVLRPAPEQLSSDDAHDRFLAILDETVDVDLLVALDVAQGESLAQAPLAQIKALHSALSESGAEVADHDDFLDRVEAEYLKYFTAKGRETGEYKELIAQVPVVEAAYEDLLERSRGMDDLVDNHARAAARLETVRIQLTQASEDKEEAEKASAAIAELKTVLDQVTDRAKSAARDEQIARESLDRRTTLIEEVTAAEDAVDAGSKEVSELESSQKEQDTEFETAQKAVDAKQEVLNASRSSAKDLTRELTRARARADLTDLSQRLETVRDHDERRTQAQATIASIAVTSRDVETLNSLATDLRIAENAKTSAAARIVATQVGDQAVTVDDAIVGQGATEDVAVVKDVHITIGGIADITIRPGISPAELDQAITSAKRAFDAECERLGVDSVEQARERAHRRADAEAVLAESTSTLKALLGNEERTTLEAKLARAQELAGANVEDSTGDDDSADGESSAERETDTADEADTTATRSIKEFEAAVEEAEKAADTAQRDLDAARTNLDRLRTSRDEARVATVRAQTTLQEASAQHVRLKESLEQARAAAADEDLETAVKAAASESEAIAAKVTEARANYEAADPETLEMQLQNARQLVLSKETQRETDRQKVDQLSALIDDRASEGIYEKLAAAEETMESARRRLSRLRRQARAIDLLRSTVLAHKEEAQRKYVAPFKEQIERLGRLVFGPGLSVEVSENLEIVSRTLNERTVAFESLSGGTKEQLALIGRLAVATLVDSDSGAPVILDDAFGFADAERLNALNVILGTVGQRAQVILLTCQPDRFGNIGGATTVSLS